MNSTHCSNGISDSVRVDLLDSLAFGESRVFFDALLILEKCIDLLCQSAISCVVIIYCLRSQFLIVIIFPSRIMVDIQGAPSFLCHLKLGMCLRERKGFEKQLAQTLSISYFELF